MTLAYSLAEIVRIDRELLAARGNTNVIHLSARGPIVALLQERKGHVRRIESSKP